MTVDIDKLAALEKAATPRPWLAKANELLWVGPDSLARHGRIVYPTLEDECIFHDGNAEMIAAVRNALPELLAEVRRLRRVEEAAKEVAANEAEDIDSRLRYVSVQPGRDEWAALKAALCNRTE